MAKAESRVMPPQQVSQARMIASPRDAKPRLYVLNVCVADLFSLFLAKGRPASVYHPMVKQDFTVFCGTNYRPSKMR